MSTTRIQAELAAWAELDLRREQERIRKKEKGFFSFVSGKQTGSDSKHPSNCAIQGAGLRRCYRICAAFDSPFIPGECPRLRISMNHHDNRDSEHQKKLIFY